jgi:prepilin-type N-terminal cleavage/methylation domain-containing protein
MLTGTVTPIPRRTTPRAFTLIELLVVVSIIVLLLAMLLPALGKGVAAAQLAQCESNARQVGAADALYLTDSTGFFPSYIGGTSITERNFGGKKGTEYNDYDVRLLNQYVGVDRPVTTIEEGTPLMIFACPSDNGAAPGGYGADRQPRVFDCFGYSYFYNGGGNDNVNGIALWNTRLSQVRSPARMVAFCDFSFDAWGWAWARPPAVPFEYMYWHSADVGWGSVNFVDGHVAYMKSTESSPNYQNGDGYTFLYDH